MKKLTQQPILYWTLELLALALLILIVAQLKFILEPIGQFIGAVFLPIVISGFLYYLLNPIVTLLEKVPLTKTKKLSRTIAITIVMVISLFLLVVGGINLVPRVVTQLVNIVSAIPDVIKEAQKFIQTTADTPLFKQLDAHIDTTSWQSKFEKFAESFLSGTANGMSSLIAAVMNITVTSITVPVMTIYMLADGKRLVPFLQRVFPKLKQDRVGDIIGRLNDTISHYITGQVIEMIFVGVFTTVGYFLIGEKYALLLGVVAGIANIIPYVGPYIGIVPAIMVALTQSTWQVVWVVVVVLIVQQIDGNLLYPRIIGATLNIHPMTIIVILLAAGNIAGIPGMILAIPLYAVVRTLVVYAWELFHLSDLEELES